MSDEPQTDSQRELLAQTGITPEQFRTLVKPLFLAMHSHGIQSVQIRKRAGNADVTIRTDEGREINGWGQ